MNPIIPYNQVANLAIYLQEKQESVVIVGGCFDILHVGHIALLNKAKEQGDCLVILLESDLRIKKLKGENRPINTQSDRAIILTSLKFVDYVILLPNVMEDSDYDTLVNTIKPAIIATTKNDPYIHHKRRQAENVRGKVIEVVAHMKKHSTTKKAEQLLEKKL